MNCCPCTLNFAEEPESENAHGEADQGDNYSKLSNSCENIIILVILGGGNNNITYWRELLKNSFFKTSFDNGVLIQFHFPPPYSLLKYPSKLLVEMLYTFLIDFIKVLVGTRK